MRPVIAAALLLAACSDAALGPAPLELDRAGRVVALTAPESERAARSAGCMSYGAKLGAGFGNLVLLSGGMEQHLEPVQDSGRINLVLLANVIGEDSPFELQFLRGELTSSGTFVVRRDAFTGGDPSKGARIRYPDARRTEDGWVETGEASFAMPVPIFSDFISELELVATRFTGKLEVGERGLGVMHGVITGYAVEPAIRSVLSQVERACQSPQPPEVCPFLNDVLARGDGTDPLEAVLTFVGGYDARIEDGHPYPCDPAATPTDCNAVSACLVSEIEPVTIAGVEP